MKPPTHHFITYSSRYVNPAKTFCGKFISNEKFEDWVSAWFASYDNKNVIITAIGAGHQTSEGEITAFYRHIDHQKLRIKQTIFVDLQTRIITYPDDPTFDNWLTILKVNSHQ